MAIDHNDIYSIVERLRILEEGLTPVNVKHGLNPQQKSVNQLDATFKPKTVAVLTAKKDPKNPMAGKLVGGSESVEYENNDIDPESDRSTIASESKVAEDVLDKVKASFADYLKSVADEVKQDSDIKEKGEVDHELGKKDKTDRDLIAKEKKEEVEEATVEVAPAPVKCVTNECGLWEIYGDTQRGFVIHHANRAMKSRFKNLEEAEIALEMFAARKRAKDESADYIEEA